MKKCLIGLMSFLVCFMLAACSVEKLKTEKLRDIEFTVLNENEIPEEFMTEISEREKKTFKLTYEDQGYLYIAEGYGRQESSGYSIQVGELYETENAIYVRTDLIGPTNDEAIVERPTYPYIVLKMESVDKHVVFQ